MDRNIFIPSLIYFGFVALRKESVDRNPLCFPAWVEHPAVALRKESVDRNLVAAGSLTTLGGSLSARRAWIEIHCVFLPGANIQQSLSARRAWIEIQSFWSAY